MPWDSWLCLELWGRLVPLSFWLCCSFLELVVLVLLVGWLVGLFMFVILMENFEIERGGYYIRAGRIVLVGKRCSRI